MRYEGSEHLSDVPRALLLGAVGEVVHEEGYGRLTVSRLVGRAGVNARTFRSLFESPEDCFVQAFEEAALNAEGIAAYEYGRTRGVWRVKVRAALGAVLAFLDERPDLCAVLVVEPVKAGPRMAECYAKTVHRVARALQESVAKTTTNGNWLSVVDAECTVQSVVGLYRGYLLDSGRQEASSSSLKKPTHPAKFALLAETGMRAEGECLPASVRDRGRRPIDDQDALVDRPAPLLGVLMSMFVLRTEGCAAAEAEINRAADAAADAAVATWAGRPKDRNEVLKGLGMRVTYRTLRVLEAIVELKAAELKGRDGVRPCNRQIAGVAGITDEGQISKLLRRLQEKGLIEEVTGNVGKRTGLPYEWRLTKSGEELVRAAKTDSTREDHRPRHERRGSHR